MKPSSETYETMYEGKMYETFIDKDPIVHNHAVYWDDEIGYEISKSNRLELSKPTVVVDIPLKKLGLEDADVVARDYILRAFASYIRLENEVNDNRKRTYKENGHFFIYEPNHKILNRNVITTRVVAQKYYEIVKKDTIIPLDGAQDVPSYKCVCIMLQVQLPEGKHKKAVQMLTKTLPDAVNRFIDEFDHDGLKAALELHCKQHAIRAWLRDSEYCAFVANGSILPRKSGSDAPMTGAIPFQSTKDAEVEVEGIRGMAFRKGVTVITGGGYSGKSTLLDALSAGIYDHIAGDGRELVITDDSAMKISAEDGRSVRHVNLSPFIKWIPGGDPTDFSTEHASGSTSQAANIMEAINWGVQLLMIDEDKSATNFMIQDPVMKNLIGKEPITPFVERVQELYEKKRVSTILVIGGSSEYLEVADRIYMMSDYQIHEITKDAKELRKQAGFQTNKSDQRIPECDKYLQPSIDKKSIDISNYNCTEILPADFSNNDTINANYLTTHPEGMATEVLKVSDLGFLILGEEQVDIRMIHDIATIPQLNAIAFLLRKLINKVNPLERYQKYSLEKLEGAATEGAESQSFICRQDEVEKMLEQIEQEGMESAYSTFFTECGRWMDLPRKYEILAVLSRMRFVDGTENEKSENDR